MSADKTVKLLEHLVQSKHNLANMLTSKGEEASVNDPFDDLVQKAGDYIPKTYIFVDDDGNEAVGTLVDQETVFTATANDIREGKVAASELGMVTGEKVIPAYHTTHSAKVIPNGSECSIYLPRLNCYEYTKFQAIICGYNTDLSDSVSVSKVVIDDTVYEVLSVVGISEITVNASTKTIDFGITNTSGSPYIIRFFTYKEIE